MMMAGRAAEEMVFGEFTSGAADDLNRAATLARRMVGELGMGAPTTTASLAISLPGADAAEAAERTEQAARGLLEDAFTTATRILEENRDLLHQVRGRPPRRGSPGARRPRHPLRPPPRGPAGSTPPDTSPPEPGGPGPPHPGRRGSVPGDASLRVNGERQVAQPP